jgi:hypothetical protein
MIWFPNKQSKMPRRLLSPSRWICVGHVFITVCPSISFSVKYIALKIVTRYIISRRIWSHCIIYFHVFQLWTNIVIQLWYIKTEMVRILCLFYVLQEVSIISTFRLNIQNVFIYLVLSKATTHPMLLMQVLLKTKMLLSLSVHSLQ